MTLVHVLILPRMTRTAFSPESIQSLCPLWHISQTAIKKLLIPTDVQIGSADRVRLVKRVEWLRARSQWRCDVNMM